MGLVDHMDMRKGKEEGTLFHHSTEERSSLPVMVVRMWK